MTERAPTPQGAATRETIASYLLPLLKALDGRGIDGTALLRRAGIDHGISSDPLARLPAERMGEVFRLCSEATADPYFGLYASRFMLPAHIHALGGALLASRSLEDFCERLQRYGRFLAGTVDFRFERGVAESMLGAQEHLPIRREATDMFWSFVLRFMRHLSPGQFNPLRVELACSETAEAVEAYGGFYRCPVSFGHDRFALYFDSVQIQEPLATASEELAAMSDQVVRDYLAKLQNDDIPAQVGALLVVNLPAGEYSKEEAAQALHMSSRTLHKKLRAANTTWRELVDATRFELARGYLRSGRYSLSEVGFMLGFNDASSFSRAFRRWSGTTPGSYADRRR